MKDIWLSKLNPDEVGQPYIDVRAHRAFWESIASTAQSCVAQINANLIGGDLGHAREITKQGLEQIERNKAFFVDKYHIEETND